MLLIVSSLFSDTSKISNISALISNTHLEPFTLYDIILQPFASYLSWCIILKNSNLFLGLLYPL